MTPDPKIADSNLADSNVTEEPTSTELDHTQSDPTAASELNASNDANETETDSDGYEDVADEDDTVVAAAIDTEASEEIEAAKAAFDASDFDANEQADEQADEEADADQTANLEAASDEVLVAGESAQEEQQLVELAVPFVGQWNQLISTSNWEKGRIISDWRAALIESGVQSSQYSDEAWTRRVGGVTAPHVGRLRRVHDRFASTFATYEGLYWSHFLAALDWDDAPLWLEGASKESWSVAGMREQRWQAHGAVESNRPTSSQIVEVDLDEDVDPTLPADGGGRTKEYGDESGVASGPVYEAPDFGDEEELMSLGGAGPDGSSGISAVADPDQAPSASIQPFAGLPELPDDLSDAVESFKLAMLRHKTSKWEKVSADTVEKYLQAFAVLLSS